MSLNTIRIAVLAALVGLVAGGQCVINSQSTCGLRVGCSAYYYNDGSCSTCDYGYTAMYSYAVDYNCNGGYVSAT